MSEDGPFHRRGRAISSWLIPTPSEGWRPHIHQRNGTSGDEIPGGPIRANKGMHLTMTLRPKPTRLSITSG